LQARNVKTLTAGLQASPESPPPEFSHNLSSLGYTAAVVSLRFGGVRFVVYSNDHPPRHVHGFYGETEVIVDLRRDRSVALAKRSDAVRSGNAKRSHVKKILKTAANRFDELAGLWEGIHAETNDRA